MKHQFFVGIIKTLVFYRFSIVIDDIYLKIRNKTSVNLVCAPFQKNSFDVIREFFLSSRFFQSNFFSFWYCLIIISSCI